ncbi:MAG: hypothetical protein ABID87_01380, partial [Chloroflexota bacterium]
MDFLTPAIALIAIFVSIYAVYIDNVHFNQSFKAQSQQYQELTIPYTQHQQSLDMLNRLDARMLRSKDWVYSWSKLNHPIQEFEDKLSLVQTLTDSADKS